MPSLNPSYSEKAIESILNQTHFDFEFIIIDDGSGLENKKILENFSNKDRRIKIIQNEKTLGITKSLNIGIKNSVGDYIARMDDDDVSLPNRLQDQLNCLIKNNFDFIGSGVEHLDYQEDIIRSKAIKIKNLQKQLFKGNFFIHSTFFGKNKVFQELYDENFKRAQDYEFLLRILGKGYRIGFLEKPVLKYRQSPNSISATKNREQEWFAIKARWKAITEFDYNFSYIFYILRSFFVFLIPYRFKHFLTYRILK